jgi:hypothetical protein
MSRPVPPPLAAPTSCGGGGGDAAKKGGLQARGAGGGEDSDGERGGAGGLGGGGNGGTASQSSLELGVKGQKGRWGEGEAVEAPAQRDDTLMLGGGREGAVCHATAATPTAPRHVPRPCASFRWRDAAADANCGSGGGEAGPHMRTDALTYPSGATGGGGSGGQGRGEARGESAANMSRNDTSQNLSQKQRFDRLLGKFIVSEDCPNCGLLFTCGHRAHLRKCLDVSASASGTHAESAAMKGTKGEVWTGGGAVGTGGGAAGQGSTPKPPPTHLMAGGEFLHVGLSLKHSVHLDEGLTRAFTHDPTSEFFLEQGITPWGHPAVPCSIGVTVSELHEENDEEGGLGGAFSALPLSPSAPPSCTTTARSGTRTARTSSSGISLSLSSFRSLDAGGDGAATSRRGIATVMVKQLVACGHSVVIRPARPRLAKDLKSLTFIGAEDDRSEPKSALTDMELLHAVSSDAMPASSGASTARAPGRTWWHHSTPLQQRAALLYTQALAERKNSLSARDASNSAGPGKSLPRVCTGADVIVDEELFVAKRLIEIP